MERQNICDTAEISIRNTRTINGDKICVVCGDLLPTESGRMICKECEENYES